MRRAYSAVLHVARLLAALGPWVGCAASGAGAPPASAAGLPDAAETRCRAGTAAPGSRDCFTAGSAYDRGAQGHPLRQATAIELFVLGCKASADHADDPSCGALKNEIVSLQLAVPRRVEARALLETMCEAGVKDLCNDLALAYRDGVGGQAEPVRALALFDRTCRGERADGSVAAPRGRANLDASMAACQELAELLRSGSGGIPKDEPRAVAADARAAALSRLAQ